MSTAKSITSKVTLNSTPTKKVQPNGVGGIVVKVLIKAMKKYRNKIISAVSKLNKNWGKKFASKYDRILNILSKAKGGAESALASALMKVGFSKSNAELIADVVVMAVSFLI